MHQHIFFKLAKISAQQLLTKQKWTALSLTFSTFILPSPRNCNFSNSTHYLQFTHIFKITILLFIHSFLSLICQVVEIFISSINKILTQQVYENLYACYYLTNHTPSLYLMLVYQLQHQVEDESKWIYILIF